MNLRSSKQGGLSSPKGEQRGVYTIAAVAIISALTLIAARSITSTTVDSVRLTSNTHFAAEASLAAEAAVSQARVWLETPNDPSTVIWPASQAGTVVEFDVVNGGQTSTRSYATTFGFQVSGEYVRVFGKASNGAGSTAVVSEWVKEEKLTFDTSADVPLALDCIQGPVNGNPDIHADPDGVPPNTGITLSQSASCPKTTFDNLNGQNGEGVIADTHDAGDQWSRVFDIDRSDFYAAYAAGEYAGLGVYVYQAASMPNSNAAPDTFTMPSFPSGAEFQTKGPGSSIKAWGTPAEPAIVVVQGCPSLSGNYTFVGILYIESATNPTDTSWTCDLQGMGAFKVIGSIIVNGTSTAQNSNFEVISADAADVDPNNFPSLGYSGLPGTWIDLEVN